MQIYVDGTKVLTKEDLITGGTVNGTEALTKKKLTTGGRNYILNSGDFSLNWLIHNGAVTGDSYSGGKVLSLNPNGDGFNSASQSIQKTTSQTVIWSVYAKADNSGDKLHTELFGGGGKTDQALTTSWSRYTFQGTFNPTRRDLYFWGASGNKGNVQMALPNLKDLKAGTTIADWTPAPEDKVNVADMRKPANGVGIEEINAEQVNNEFTDRGVNVKWFGAKCDGTTDDSTAIQAVIDKFVGHQILFPANSKVVIKKPLALKSNTKINLNGSTLVYSGVKAPNMVNMIGVGNNNILKNVELKSGTLDGSYLCDYNFEMTVASGANLIDMKFADPLIANCNVHKDNDLTCDGFYLSNGSAVNSKQRMGLTSLIINTSDCLIDRFVAVDYGRGILNGGTNYYNAVRSWCYNDAIIKDSVFMETSGTAMCSNMYMDTWFIGYKFVGSNASVFINQSGSFYNETAYKLTSGHKVPYMLWFDEGAEKSLFVATNVNFYGLQVGGSEFSNLSQMPTGVRLNNCVSNNVRGIVPDQSAINRYRDNTADADLSVKSNGSLHSNPETRIYKVKLNPTLTIRALKVGGKFTEKGNWTAPDQPSLTVNDGWLVSAVDSSGAAYAEITLTDALSDNTYHNEASDTYYIQGLMECGGELDINISGATNGVVQNNAGTDKLSMIIQGYNGPGSSGDPVLLFKSASGFRLKDIIVINVTKELNTRYLMDTVSDLKTRLDKIVNNVWFEGPKQFSQGLKTTDKFIIKSVPKCMMIPLFPDGNIVKEGVSISDNTDNGWIYSKFYFNKASQALFKAIQTGGLYATGSLGDHNPPEPNTNGINFYYDEGFKTILKSRDKPDVAALPSSCPNNTIRVEFIIKDTYTGPYTATFRDVVLSYQNRPVVSSSEISIADDYQEIIGYKDGAFMIAPAADNQATMAAIDVI